MISNLLPLETPTPAEAARPRIRS